LKNKREKVQYYNQIEDMINQKKVYESIIKYKKIIIYSDHKKIIEKLKFVIQS